MTCNCNDKPFCHCGEEVIDHGHESGHDQRDEFSDLYLELGGEG